MHPKTTKFQRLGHKQSNRLQKPDLPTFKNAFLQQAFVLGTIMFLCVWPCSLISFALYVQSCDEQKLVPRRYNTLMVMTTTG